jgi:hypothetical protein
MYRALFYLFYIDVKFGLLHWDTIENPNSFMMYEMLLKLMLYDVCCLSCLMTVDWLRYLVKVLCISCMGIM